MTHTPRMSAFARSWVIPSTLGASPPYPYSAFSATMALTASAPWSAISNVTVEPGGRYFFQNCLTFMTDELQDWV